MVPFTGIFLVAPQLARMEEQIGAGSKWQGEHSKQQQHRRIARQRGSTSSLAHRQLKKEQSGSWKLSVTKTLRPLLALVFRVFSRDLQRLFEAGLLKIP